MLRLSPTQVKRIITDNTGEMQRICFAARAMTMLHMKSMNKVHTTQGSAIRQLADWQLIARCHKIFLQRA